MQRGVAATTIILVLDFFGGFACLKAFGVARVRHELCDGESNALQGTFWNGFIFKTGSSEPTRLLKYDLSN